MHGKILTEGNIPRQMWSLAWPMMLSVFFYTLYNTVDAFWVGKISPEAIAAVGISQVTLFAMVSLSMGLTVGSGVLMAMSIGHKDMKQAERLLGQSFVLSVVSAVFFTAIALIFSTPILKAAGATGSIFPLAQSYYLITAAGMVLLFIMMAVIFAFNSQGDTFTLTKLFAVSTFANIVLDPLMIFGWGGFPAMGIAGAAVATLASQVIFVVMSIYVLSRPSMMVPFRFRNLVIVKSTLPKVFSIGLPAALTNVLGPLGTAALLAIASYSFGGAGAVSASIGFRVEFFAYLPAIGYGFGAMAMLGQNIGAGNFARAKAAYTHGLKIGFGIALALGILSAIFSTQIISFFTIDPLVTQYTRWYLLSIPLSYGFLAALLIEASAFQGIGKSWPGLWISVIKFAVVAVPLSVFFVKVLHTSIMGIWAAMILGNVIAAIFGFFWLNRNLSVHIREQREKGKEI